MFSILPSLIARLKALVLTFIVADLEADLAAVAGERKAELLRQADQYEQSDLPSVAEQLRRQTEAIASEKPLASVTATIAHLQADRALLQSADGDAPLPAASPSVSASAHRTLTSLPSRAKKNR